MTSKPPSALIALTEKFVWHPAPFQSPSIGLGLNDTMQLWSSVTVHDVASHGHVVPDVDTTARTDLVFPLAGHDLRVDPGNLHACLEALDQVLIRDRAADGKVEAHTCVVGALGRR